MGKLRRAVRVGKIAFFMLSAALSTHVGAAAKFDAMDPLGTVRKGHVAKKRTITVDIAPGDWGRAEVRDIQRVLDSVADELSSDVGAAGDDLHIRVLPRGGSPRVLYERDVEGQYVVQLTARDDRWFQYVYQFAHELCHVLSNFDNKEGLGDEKVDESNQWFEESLCETASLFTLQRLAVVWETNPPTRNWSGYGKVLSAYAVRLIDEPHRRLAAGQSFRDWFLENKASLSGSPYQREKNELVAANILPLFAAHPELWQAIAYLNPSKASAGKSFAQYLADWRTASPDKALPDQVIDLFGLPDGSIEVGAGDGPSQEKLVAAPSVSRHTANGPAGE